MKPTFEELQTGSHEWVRKHLGVSYSLSHHGISDYSPQGTWCYYLFLRPDLFQSADDFARFDVPETISDLSEGSMPWRSYEYYSIPDLDFHGGVTWYSKEPYFDRANGVTCELLKIGCDYNHSWDRDEGYWQGLEDIGRDAKRSVEALARMCPLNSVCEYSGWVAHPDEFYTAINGRVVHQSMEAKAEGTWMRADPVTLSRASAA